jgi:hypothetical protein
MNLRLLARRIALVHVCRPDFVRYADQVEQITSAG